MGGLEQRASPATQPSLLCGAPSPAKLWTLWGHTCVYQPLVHPLAPPQGPPLSAGLPLDAEPRCCFSSFLAWFSESVCLQSKTQCEPKTPTWSGAWAHEWAHMCTVCSATECPATVCPSAHIQGCLRGLTVHPVLAIWVTLKVERAACLCVTCPLHVVCMF